jgi:UDP-galactopyranose mutase
VAPPIGDVLCLSHLRWGFVFQRPNHLMTRCARESRVFYVEEPAFDGGPPRLESRRVKDRLSVVVPHLPPEMANWPLLAVERTLESLLAELVAERRIRRPVVWFYTPMAMGFASKIDASAVVYDCMDELSHFDGAPPLLGERERKLFDVADIVFTGGQSLYEAKRGRHPRVHAFPSSVDAAHFGRAKAKSADPPDQARIPRPRLGFFGVVDERMDVSLLTTVARARSDLHFVILGPVVKIDPRRLPRLPNIHWLGAKRYEELPDYIAGWDVAIMPFARNAATKFISPTKTLEYLAAGKPVVSTSIRDVVSPYGERGLVNIADSPADFVSAVDEALAARGTERETERRAASEACVASTSWDSTWDRMRALVQSRLASRLERAEPWGGAG